jgi:radical SAM superfamily enzyme YgiQ (UPF0313 family)
VFTLDTGRGCPFSCTFCYNSIFHKGQRGDFSVEYIINQIEYLKENYGVEYILFFEDNFTFNRKKLRVFCQSIIDRKIQIKWDCESRAELSQSDISLMANAGCTSVALGVETGSKRLLNFLKKDIDLDMMQETFWNLVKYNIKPIIYIMEAIPTETVEDFELTQQLLHTLDDPPFEYARFVPYPGTPLYNYCVEKRLIIPPKSLAEWALFTDDHYSHANLSQVPDQIINEAFTEWDSSYTTRRERFYYRYNL